MDATNRSFDLAALDASEDGAPRSNVTLALAIMVFLLLLVGTIVYALVNGSAGQRWVFWTAIAAAIISLFGLLAFAALRNEASARVELTEPTYLEAFRYGPDPTLITREGVPVLANDAYVDLAERVGVVGESGVPPTLDRLFAASSSHDVAASLYRLLQHGVGREVVNVIDEHSRLRTYEVDATRLSKATEGATLWRVRDLSGPEPEAIRLADAPVGLATVLKSGRIVAVNPTLRRWLGLGPQSLPRNLEDMLADADSVLDTPAEPGRTQRFDSELLTDKGVASPTVAVASWSRLEDDTPIASIAFYGHSNIASRAPAQVAQPVTAGLQAGDTFSAAPFAIAELAGTDLSTATITRTNPAFQRMTGRTQQGVAFSKIFVEPDPRLVQGDPRGFDINEAIDARVASRQDEPIYAQVHIVCHPREANICWAYIVDITQRQMLQEQLVQSQKMQAIGQLAAGVAHDFNNLLNAIRLNTDDLLGRHPLGDPDYLELQSINSNGMRAAALVKKLLAFSRRQTRRAVALDVSETLSDLSHTLRQTLSERVALKIDHGRDLPPIRMDKSQLETVLINLCVNARDAMVDPETGAGSGVITIRSRAVDVGKLPIRAAHEGRAVRIEVEDTGAGMDEATLSRIFEPFFSTKNDHGTGLGLATVYGIVDQSGGHLDVESTPGEGTVFRITLPTADPALATEETVKSAEPKAPANLSGQGTILFVEDEESVRTIAAKTLRKRGYNVVEAGDGEEAYEWLEGGEAVDLLISDVVMPGMDGPTLLKKGRDMLGEARIVFISGYAQEEFSDLLAEEPDVTFLPKPFSLAQLAEKVKAEIGEAKAA